MTTTPGDPTTALPGRPPVVDQATWQAARDDSWSARRPTPARATPSPRPAAGCRWWSSTGRSRSSDPTARSRSWTCSRAATSSWSTSTCGGRRAAPGPVRGLHDRGLEPEGCRVPQRPRGLVRDPDDGPLGGGGLLRRVHGVHRALVLGPGRGGTGWRGHGPPDRFLRDGDRMFITYSTTGRATRRRTASWACST